MSQPLLDCKYIDLNSSTYELHPAPKDSEQTLTGNHCSLIRFSDTLSCQIESFLENNECHHGMEIGNIEFLGTNRGTISFDRIHRDLCHCPLSVMTEPNINTEIYETEYDRPPSNAMFLQRKGFVHSKLLIKLGPTNDRSSMSYTSRQSSQRATTAVKAIRGSQRFKRANKRRSDALNNGNANVNVDGAVGPPRKRLKAGTTLNEAIGELLYHGEKDFDDMRKVVSARTAITVTVSELAIALKEMADLYAPTGKYYLKTEHHAKVDWADSSVLTDAEKRSIKERSQGAEEEKERSESVSVSVPELTPTEKNKCSVSVSEAETVPMEQRAFEAKYGVVADQSGYKRYSAAYTEKAAQMKKYATAVTENTNYFRTVRGNIKAEKDAEKQKKMKTEFRQIFNQRNSGIKQMKQESAKLSFELIVLKKRINAYVTQQQRPAN